MAESLEAWITRQLRLVEESGKSTRAFRLCAADTGKTWERFDSPLRLEEEGGLGPAKLAEEMELVIRNTSEEVPARTTFQVSVVAEDGEGLERATFVKSVRGRSTTANGAILGGEHMHLAQAGQVHTEITKSLLGMQHTVNASLQKQNERQTEQINFLIETLTEKRIEKALNDEEQKEDVAEKMTHALSEQVGPLMEMVMNAINKPNGTGVN